MSLWFGLSEQKQLWRILKASYIPCDCNARLELLQPYLLPNNHSWVPLPPVSRSVSVCKWASQSVRLRPMQHSVCTEELQDNLLMGSRGLGLSILFILIRQNCWLLFCTHTHTLPSFFFLWHALKAAAYNQPFILLKNLTPHFITRQMTSLVPHRLVLLIPKEWKWEHNKTTIQLTHHAEHSHVSVISFTLLKTSLIEHFFKHPSYIKCFREQ